MHAADALRTGPLVEVDALQQVIESALLDDYSRGTVLERCRQLKRTAVQTFVEQAEPGPVVEEDLHRIATLAEEDEQRAPARLACDALLDDAGQTVEPPAQVDGQQPDEYLDARWDHRAAL